MFTWHTTVTQRETTHCDGKAKTQTDRSTYYTMPEGCGVTITPGRVMVTIGDGFSHESDLLELDIPEDRITDAIVSFIAYRQSMVKRECGCAYSLQTLERVADAMGLSYNRPTPEA